MYDGSLDRGIYGYNFDMCDVIRMFLKDKGCFVNVMC
jgi:hypothetical protein